MIKKSLMRMKNFVGLGLVLFLCISFVVAKEMNVKTKLATYTNNQTINKAETCKTCDIKNVCDICFADKEKNLKGTGNNLFSYKNRGNYCDGYIFREDGGEFKPEFVYFGWPSKKEIASNKNLKFKTGIPNVCVRGLHITSKVNYQFDGYLDNKKTLSIPNFNVKKEHLNGIFFRAKKSYNSKVFIPLIFDDNGSLVIGISSDYFKKSHELRVKMEVMYNSKVVYNTDLFFKSLSEQIFYCEISKAKLLEILKEQNKDKKLRLKLSLYDSKLSVISTTKKDLTIDLKGVNL